MERGARSFSGRSSTQTIVVLAYGLAWGVVNWGFISFLPTFLRGAGFSAATSSYLLFLSAFVADPRNGAGAPSLRHVEQPSKHGGVCGGVDRLRARPGVDGAVCRQQSRGGGSMLALLYAARAA